MIGKIEQFVNGSAATKAGPVTFQTACTLIEIKLTVVRRLQTGFDQQLIGIMKRLFTVSADHANEPLRQDTIQSRNKVVRVDTHVQESAEDVNHVIRVNCGEHK